MELQEMKNLESEVKGLHHLMQEVHKNQVELNRVLLSKCTYSRSVRFGDPEVPQDGEAPKTISEDVEVMQSRETSPQIEETTVKANVQKSDSPSCSDTIQDDRVSERDECDPPESSERQKVQQKMTCVPPKQSNQSSSFIRNILSEDSRAGVAIIDLFLTVKMAKDNLQCLSKSNAEAFDKIKQLKSETVAIGKGYRILLDDMRDLLSRMNETILQRRTLPAVIHLRGKTSYRTKLSDYVPERTGDEENSRGSQTPMTSQDSEIEMVRSEDAVRDEADSRGARKKLGGTKNQVKRDRRQVEFPESSSSGCLSCFVSSHRDILFDELPDLSEASLASFMATLFRMQKGDRRVCETCKSSSFFATSADDDESEGKLSLSDSSFRMFCNICEVLDGAAREDLGSDQDSMEDAEREDGYSFMSGIGIDRNDRPSSHHPTGPSSSHPVVETPKNCVSCRKKSLRTKSSKRQAAAETEPEFDDTAGCLVRPPPRPEAKAKPSVTCMGDLTRAVPGKKNVSTLTTTNNILSYRKLPNDIRSKIKKIRSKRNIKVEKQKSGKGFRKSFGKNRSSKVKGKALRDIGVPSQGQATFPMDSILYPDSDIFYPTTHGNLRGDDYMSEDSFHNCDSESADAGFNSGEDDLEEFVEIFNESTRTAGKAATAQHDRAITWHDEPVDFQESTEFEPSNSFLGFLHKTTLKTIRALFFEIQKCYPANFVQEILPKRMIPAQEEVMGDGSISLKPGENKQKKVVIKGSSTDFVIYIQVEMEEGSRTGSQEFVVEQRSATFGVQTGNFVQKQFGPAMEAEEDDGQSVGDIWEECDGGRLSELEEPETVVAYSEVEKLSYSHRVQTQSLYVDAWAQSFITEIGPKWMATAILVVLKETKSNADVWLQQNGQQKIFFVVRLDGVASETAEAVEPEPGKPQVLEKALHLIREVETDIADVKLSDAISILPRLEWELRKHLQSKMKIMGEAEKDNDLEKSLLSSSDLCPEEGVLKVEDKEASERMRKLLMLLTELEDAIRLNESVNGVSTCQYDSSRVYKLLRALVTNIQGLEGNASVSNLSQTLDIASQLDTAVRDFDSVVRRRPTGCSSPESENWKTNQENVEPVPEKQHLKNVRKKVFQTVEGEALQLEGRVEKDFGRLTQLERENDEAMMFLEAFLQKMGRRMSELNSLKGEIKKLSSSIQDKQESLMEKIVLKNKEIEEREAEALKRARELKEAEAEAEKRAAQAKEAEEEAQRRAAQVKEAEAETKKRAARLKEAEVEAQRRANQLKEAEAQRRVAQIREAEAERRAAKAKEVEAQRKAAQAREAEAQKKAAQLREAEAEAQKKVGQAEAEKKAARIEAEKKAARIEAEKRAAQAEADRKVTLLKEAEAEAERRAAQLKEAESIKRAAQLREAEAEAEKLAAQLKEAEAQRRAALMREAEAKSRAALMKEAEAEAQRRANQLKVETIKTAPHVKETDAEKKAAEAKEVEKKGSELKEAENKATKQKEAEAQERAAQAEEPEPSRKVTQVKETETSKDVCPSCPKEVVLRETVSGLLMALDKLKARAREKNQLCKEILSSSCSDKMRVSANSSRRASRSSFTAKHTDTLTSSVKTFRKIGPSSLYLAWTKPEGSLREFVSGYEIYLNGKLNQKVRDARRLQAVLYSVDFTNTVDLEMYAIAENRPKMLLLTARYQDD